MITSIILIFSLLFAVVFVTIKYFEIKKGKDNKFLSLLRRFDPIFEKFIQKSSFRSLQFYQILRYVCLFQSKSYCKFLISKLEEKIAAEFHARYNTIMGQRQIATNNSTSFYLKKIAETKNGNKGKINDDTIDLVLKD